MSTAVEVCQLCHKENFKYTCPKCNILYCSVNCYKSQEHLKCSEDFYKGCIQEELTTAEPRSREDIRKIYDILKRIRETDAGIEQEDIENGFDKDALDSDDDEPPAEEAAGVASDDENENEANDVEDIAARLQGIDINDADEVWRCLTTAEREEFEKLLETGDIMKLLPAYKPWWLKSTNSKIVVLASTSSVGTSKSVDENSIPEIVQKISIFSNICKKTPSPCLHYNIWNILAAYSCTARFFGGEHLMTPGESAAHLVNLSGTLKYGTNYEDADDAIISVEMEALTTGNAGPNLVVGATTTAVLVESREQLQHDTRQLMANRHYKLAALSDILQLLQLARRQVKTAKQPGNAEFQKLFAVCAGSVELNRTKLQQLMKKIEFMLSYVNRDNECDYK